MSTSKLTHAHHGPSDHRKRDWQDHGNMLQSSCTAFHRQAWDPHGFPVSSLALPQSHDSASPRSASPPHRPPLSTKACSRVTRPSIPTLAMAVVSPTSDTVLANADAAWPAAAETTALVTVLAAAAAPGNRGDRTQSQALTANLPDITVWLPHMLEKPCSEAT